MADIILGIESSCDDTSAAVLRDGVLLSNVIASQQVHKDFGGVVPELASRAHEQNIVPVVSEALRKAGVTPADLTAIAFTRGPGLLGSLLVGTSFAKALSLSLDIPMVMVNHLQGHILANFVRQPDKPVDEPSFPYLCLLVSGGNSQIVKVNSPLEYEILGQTIDDAVGEAFDKCSKMLGLGYPGGPVISKLSAKGNPRAIAFPRAMMHSGDYRFSLSGLKTAVITYIQGENKAGRAINLPDLAASFEAAVIDVQVAKAARAIEETGAEDFCVGGGVAANPKLREAYRQKFERMGARVTVPPLSVCGDNGAMIALVALRSYRAGLLADLSLDAAPNAKLGTWSCSLPPL